MYPLGVDQSVITDEATEGDRLATLVKLEAERTIKMLEVFMQISKQNLAIAQEPENTDQEADRKLNEDLSKNISEFQIDTHSSEYEEDLNEADLFSGMDSQYRSTNHKVMYRPNTNSQKISFSKYVEEAMKSNHMNRSIEVVKKQNVDTDRFLNTTLQVKNKISRSRELLSKPDRLK